MTPRWQPPHPARTIRRPPCPTGRPRFATRWLALAAIPISAPTELAATDCDQCSGAHHTDTKGTR